MRRPAWLLSAVLLPAVAVAALLPVVTPTAPSLPSAVARSATAQEIRAAADPPRLSAADVCNAIDDSTSQLTNDPRDQRDSAVRQTLEFLDGLEPPGRSHRVAVVRFGTTASVRLPLTGLAERPRALTTALSAGPPAGATNVPAAVRTCAQVLAGADNPVVFLVSDGHPDLGDGRPLAALFDDIAAAIADIPDVPVHVLLSVPGGVPSPLLAAWRAAGVASVTDLGTGPGWRDALVRQLVADLSATIGVLPRPSGVLDARQDTVRITVPAYTTHLSVTAFAPGGDPRLVLVDPDGRVRARKAGAIAFLSAVDPEPGTWRLSRTGGAGRVTVQAETTPLQVDLLSPAADVPVGRALQLVAEVDGYRGPQSSPLYVGAVVLNGSKAYEVELRQDPDGLWRSTRVIPAVVAGPVSVRLVLKVGPETVLDSTSRRLSAVDAPYLVASQPVVTEGQRFEWELRRSGRPVSDRVLGEDPAAAVLVHLPGGRAERARYDGDGRWSLPVSSLERLSSVRAELSSRTLSGAVVRDEVESPVVVTPPASSVRARRVVGTLAGLVTAFVLAWLAWLSIATRIRLNGHLRSSSGDGPRGIIRVRKARWHRVPGRQDLGPVVIWRRGGRLVERSGWVPWPFDARLSGFEEVAPAVRVQRPGRAGVREPGTAAAPRATSPTGRPRLLGRR